ncbi:hypothetical protein V1264_024579 [Littorina saxatilis]|uniref:Ig-like domain-containing protein n=2 Tax=Littorina saxatilis TaxID=31220 RepID=A0AAN9AL31_9CAEN
MYCTRTIFIFLSCVLLAPNLIHGTRLPGCSSDRLAVDETLNTEVTCDQFDAQNTVTWFLKAQSPQSDVLLGSCSPQGPCNQASRYTLSRSSTQSTVTITPSSDLRFIASYRIQCDASGTTTSCALDVFYPATVPSQNCQVRARSGSWTIDGSCNITKTFSSSNTYQCQVFRGTSQSSQTTPMTTFSYTSYPHSNATYRTGSCSFSSDFTGLLSSNTKRDDFYFRIDVYPGPTRRVNGPVTLEKPVPPTISCPDIVAENTTFTCTCSTTNLGQPAGRLVWSRVSGGTIIEGDYDVTTLTLPSQTLTRHDQGVKKFRCDVRWAEGTYMAVYTGNIGSQAMTADQNSAQPSSYLGVAIGLAVVLVVMVIAAIAFVIWLWRRQWLLPCTDHQLFRSAESKSSATSNPNVSLGLQPAVFQDTEGVDARGPYDSLQMSDVGMRSIYSQIDRTQETHGTELASGTVYENNFQ